MHTHTHTHIRRDGQTSVGSLVIITNPHECYVDVSPNLWAETHFLLQIVVVVLVKKQLWDTILVEKDQFQVFLGPLPIFRR